MNRMIFRIFIVIVSIVLISCPGTNSLSDPDIIPLSNTKSITVFSFESLSITGLINETDHTVSVTVPHGANVTALTPTIIHTGIDISPGSSIEQDFSTQVTYTVTAEDATTQDYIVNITIAPPPCTVDFDSLGGSSVDSQLVDSGGYLESPTSPTRSEFGFGGWYKENTFQNRWDFTIDTINTDIILYAKWYTATDGLEYTLINGDTEYGVSKGTTRLESIITIPEYWDGKKVTSIEDYGFQDTHLTSINIPDSVTTIGSLAFNTFYLTSFNIPESITTLKDKAFMVCQNLTKITIPGSITSMGDSVFSDCYSLTDVVFEEGITSIGRFAFQYCNDLVNITIPNSVTTIGDLAFSFCPSLESITIPENVTKLQFGLFRACTSLANINLPNGLMDIEHWAFNGCISLTSITIPDSVTTLGASAFIDCSNLTNLNMDSLTAPTTVYSDTFSGVTGCTLHLQSSGTTGYEGSPWVDNPPFSFTVYDL